MCSFEREINKVIRSVIFFKQKLKADDLGNIEEERGADTLKLTDEVIDEIQSRFAGISIDEARKIIFEVTNELVTELKVTKEPLRLRF